MDLMDAFERDGYVQFPYASETFSWSQAALVRAREIMDAPEQAAQWQCEGTWFVGVDALDNDTHGHVGAAMLKGPGPAMAQALFGALPLHAGQLSVVRPGYPRPRDGESDAAFGYRLRRDAAHVDGLLPLGPDRRRVLAEPHAWILGLPLTKADDAASPLVVWQGSHRVMGEALSAALRDVAPHDWGAFDLTEVYQAARRDVFARCTRVALPAKPGRRSFCTGMCCMALHRGPKGLRPTRLAASSPISARNSSRPPRTGCIDRDCGTVSVIAADCPDKGQE
ncbi:hypothetical protein ACS3SW_04880 [Roseobacteraceae bacterium S113]